MSRCFVPEMAYPDLPSAHTHCKNANRTFPEGNGTLAIFTSTFKQVPVTEMPRIWATLDARRQAGARMPPTCLGRNCLVPGSAVSLAL